MEVHRSATAYIAAKPFSGFFERAQLRPSSFECGGLPWALGRSVAHSRRAMTGHRGSLLPRRFGTSESRGIRADLTAGVGRSWSVGIAPLGAGSVVRPSRSIARRTP